MSDWYYRKQGMFDETTEGPLSDAEFLQLAYDGKLKLDTLVTSQQHTKGQWGKLGQIPAARNKLDEGVEARRQAKEHAAAEAAQHKEEKRAKAAELKQQRLMTQEAERQAMAAEKMAKTAELQQQVEAECDVNTIEKQTPAAPSWKKSIGWLAVGLALLLVAAAIIIPRDTVIIPRDTVDQPRFEPLYRSAKSIEAALSTGVNVVQLQSLIQGFATELLVAKDRATSPKEKQMLNFYATALDSLQDSSTLWRRKIDAANPKEMFLFSEFRPLIDKYEIPTQGSYRFDRFDGDVALQLIWAKALEQLAMGDGIFNS